MPERGINIQYIYIYIYIYRKVNEKEKENEEDSKQTRLKDRRGKVNKRSNANGETEYVEMSALK